ncbi:MAG: FHA domain-containing protein [Thermosynechococcaceae cyanobacterium MS004]|nr:FHA domain-containing protein [Thermosynechococcaceae cyanobacterium MS004]
MDASSVQERHVLVVNDGKRRAIALDAAAYSIGRDPSNAIVLNAETMSRQHAMLLRLPVPGTGQYRYRLIDGNAQGKLSANGVSVNGQPCRTHDLAHGDTVRFGQTVEASYLTVLMAEVEFTNYLESISYQSIKSGTINAKETLVASGLALDEVGEDRTKMWTSAPSKDEVRQRPAVSPWAETMHEGEPNLQKAAPKSHPYRLWMIAVPGVIIAIAGIVGIGLMASRGQFSKSSASPVQPNAVPAGTIQK